jgi:hypothetical protein
VLRIYCPNIYIFHFLGKKRKHSAKKDASEDDIELHPFDLTHNISNLIHDLNFFDDGQFKACYSRYHANDDLGRIFLSV